MDIKQVYNQAHADWFRKEYQLTFAAGHYTPPLFPKVATANGLTRYITQFLTWKGHRATRISSAGRVVGGKYIKGNTRRGAADISSTIKIGRFGVSVQWEIKIGADRPSEFQLREQKLEEAAGGRYYFVKSAEQFLSIYELLVSSVSQE